jgi:hypothetical protein
MSGMRPGRENVTLKVAYSFANIFITKMVIMILINAMQAEYMSTFDSYAFICKVILACFTTNP